MEIIFFTSFMSFVFKIYPLCHRVAKYSHGGCSIRAADESWEVRASPASWSKQITTLRTCLHGQGTRLSSRTQTHRAARTSLRQLISSKIWAQTITGATPASTRVLTLFFQRPSASGTWTSPHPNISHASTPQHHRNATAYAVHRCCRSHSLCAGGWASCRVGVHTWCRCRSSSNAADPAATSTWVGWLLHLPSMIRPR
jgi:hypothetical protein